MSEPASINPRIVDGLYCEALVLSDEVRGAFDMSGRLDAAALEAANGEDAARIALSCEALRTTTRMMHALAWLLNHRAYFAGDLSEFQLRRHGRLPADFPAGEAERVMLLSPELRAVVGATERFYARVVRLEMAWREREAEVPSAVERLRERLSRSVAG